MYPYEYQPSGLPSNMPDFPPTLPVLNSTSRPGSPMGLTTDSHLHQDTGLRQNTFIQSSPLDPSSSSLAKSDVLKTKTPGNIASAKRSSEVRSGLVYPSEARSVVKHSSINFVNPPAKSTTSPKVQSAKADMDHRRESDLQILRRIKIDISSGHHTSYSAIIKPLALKSVSVTAEEAESQHLAALGISPSSLTQSLASTHRPTDSSPSTSTEKAVETVLIPDTDEPSKPSTVSSTLPMSAPASIPTAPRSSLASRIRVNAPSSIPTGPSNLKDRLLSAKPEYASRGPGTTSAKINSLNAPPPTQPRAHAEGVGARRPKRPKVDLDSSKDGPDAMMLDYSGMYDEAPATVATVNAVDKGNEAGIDIAHDVEIRPSGKDAPAASQSPVSPAKTAMTEQAPSLSNNVPSSRMQSGTTHSGPPEIHADNSCAHIATTDSTSSLAPLGSAIEEQGDQMDEEEAEIETFLTSGIEDFSAAIDLDTERIDMSKPAPTNLISRFLTSSSAPFTSGSNNASIDPTQLEEDKRIQMSTFEPRKSFSSSVQSSSAPSVSALTPTAPATTSSWWNWRVPMMRSRMQSLKPESTSAIPSTVTESSPISPSPSPSSMSNPIAAEIDAAEEATSIAGKEHKEEGGEGGRLTLRTEKKKREPQQQQQQQQQQQEKVPDRLGFVNGRETKLALKEKERRDREREAREYKEARLKSVDKGKEKAVGKGGDRYHPYEKPTKGLTSPTRSTLLERQPEDGFPYRYNSSDSNTAVVSVKTNAHDNKTNARSGLLGMNDGHRPSKTQGTGMSRDDASIHRHSKPYNPPPVHAQAQKHIPPLPYQSGPVSNLAYPSRFQPSNSHPPPPPPIVDYTSTGYNRDRPSSGHIESSDWSNTVRHGPAGYRDPFPHHRQQPQQHEQHPPIPAHPTYPHAGSAALSRHPPSSFGTLSNENRSLALGSGPNESNIQILREMQALKEKLAMLEQQASGNIGTRGGESSAPFHSIGIPPSLHSQPRPYSHHEQHQHQQQDHQGFSSYGGPPFMASQPPGVGYLPPRTYEDGHERGWTAAGPILSSSSVEGGPGGRFLDQSVLSPYQLQHQHQQQQQQQQRDHIWTRDDEESRRKGWGR